MVEEDPIPKSLFLLVGGEPDPPAPGEPRWLAYPPVASHASDGTFHADVLNHYKGLLRESDLLTDTHETTHMVNADIRNGNRSRGRVNAFYVGNDRAAVFPEPGFRKSRVAPFVPAVLRGFRYKTYITGQAGWDDSPLYIFDEWSAYVNGGLTGVESVEKGLYRGGWTDGVSGCLEFSIYAAALCMAIAQEDKGYFAANPDFLVFARWQLARAEAVYDRGSGMSQFKWQTQDAMLKDLRGAPQAAPLRDYLGLDLGHAWLGA